MSISSVEDEEALANIARNVVRLRNGRSQNWLAIQAGTYAANIARIEQAENMPGAGLLSRIAKALETTVDELLSGPPKKSR